VASRQLRRSLGLLLNHPAYSIPIEACFPLVVPEWVHNCDAVLECKLSSLFRMATRVAKILAGVSIWLYDSDVQYFTSKGASNAPVREGWCHSCGDLVRGGISSGCDPNRLRPAGACAGEPVRLTRERISFPRGSGRA